MKQLLALCTVLLRACTTLLQSGLLPRMRATPPAGIRLAAVISLSLAVAPAFVGAARAEGGTPNLSGIAAFEQLRKEYYIGALYLGWPAHDTAAILAMPGTRRMEMHITADRWPALRFAQMWNQSITINTDGATLNANAMDILAFTSIPKGDLLEGDQLVVETDPASGTRVLLNGVLVQTTKSNALFNLILNAWIGSRPPTSEFKRDMLTLPTGPAASALIARYEGVRPNDARRKAVATWGVKPEAETPPPAPVAQPAPKPAEPAKPPITPATAGAPAPGRPVPSAPAAPAAKPPVEQPKPAAAAAPAPAAPQPDANAQAAASQQRAEKEKQQAALYDQYLGLVRKQVLRSIEYPRRAQKEGIEGLVVLRINLDRNGNVTGSEVAQTANDLLDAAAQKAVNKAAPYPKAPEQLDGEQFQILVPVVFKFAQ